jgi:hypothetical protein
MILISYTGCSDYINTQLIITIYIIKFIDQLMSTVIIYHMTTMLSTVSNSRQSVYDISYVSYCMSYQLYQLMSSKLLMSSLKPV